MPNLSLDTNLLWTAKEIFRYPQPQLMIDNADGIKHLADWAKRHQGDLLQTDAAWSDIHDLDWDQLEVDHTALFINGIPVAKAHPFAGWYAGDTIVFGPTDQKMRDFYCHYGVDIEEQSLPADHIMVELEFMAMMAERYAQTGEDIYYSAVKEMLTGHMEDWVFKFLEEIVNHAQTEFYRGFAQVLTLLMNELRNELKEVA